jgi:hypothetical protein
MMLCSADMSSAGSVADSRSLMYGNACTVQGQQRITERINGRIWREGRREHRTNDRSRGESRRAYEGCKWRR